MLPPIGSLLTSLANKNRFSPIMINRDDSIISVVKNDDMDQNSHLDMCDRPSGEESASEAVRC